MLLQGTLERLGVCRVSGLKDLAEIRLCRVELQRALTPFLES